MGEFLRYGGTLFYIVEVLDTGARGSAGRKTSLLAGSL